MTERFAVITGGGSGVGRASALGLARRGWTVMVLGRREDALKQTASMAQGGKIVPHAADLSKEADVETAFARVKSEFGRLDFLFNNAGMGGRAPFEDYSLEMWNQIVAINLTGAFLCARAAFRIMKDQRPQGGRIVNNGSISAHVPRPESVGYTATKHAITGLTKQISLDGRKYDIACGQIDIGNAATDMTARMANGVPQANGTVMVEPTMNAERVADGIAYMADMELDANVQFLTVMATKMPFIGRG